MTSSFEVFNGYAEDEEMLRIATSSNYIGSESLVNDTAEWMSLWKDVDDLLSSLPCEEVAVPVCSWFCSCESQLSTAACVLALFCVGAGAHRLRGPTSHRFVYFRWELVKANSVAVRFLVCNVVSRFQIFKGHVDLCRATNVLSLSLVVGE